MTATNFNLYQRLSKIAETVGYIQKDGVNAFHKYSYVSEAALLEKLRAACIANGVFILPSVEGHERFTVPMPKDERKDYPGDVTFVKTAYTLINIDNPEEKATVYAVGYGQDKGDKGIYSAQTGCYKYFGFKTFQVSSGDDPEIHKDGHTLPDGTKVNVKTGEVVGEMKRAATIPKAPTIEGKGWSLTAEDAPKRKGAPDWSAYEFRYSIPVQDKKARELLKDKAKDAGVDLKFRGEWTDNSKTTKAPGGDNCWYTNLDLQEIYKYQVKNIPDMGPPSHISEVPFPDDEVPF